MEYILLIVVLSFIIFVAYREREAAHERAEMTRQHARERSELLTRIAHPEVALVPVEDRREISVPDGEPEQDDYGMVGTVIPGLPE